MPFSDVHATYTQVTVGRRGSHSIPMQDVKMECYDTGTNKLAPTRLSTNQDTRGLSRALVRYLTPRSRLTPLHLVKPA